MKMLRVPVALALGLTLMFSTATAHAEGDPNSETTSRTSEAPVKKGRPDLAPVTADALTRSLQRAELTPAQYALQRAMTLFHPKVVAARFGDVATPDPHMATAILRDLFLLRGELTGEERAAADSLLARPDDSNGGAFGERYTSKSQNTCLEPPVKICIHWVSSGSDATTPQQVDATIATMQTVWDEEITRLGFRAPKSDKNSQNNGPNGKTDIYLANVGSDGIYGYCTSDDPRGSKLGTAKYPYYDISAYCVLDNDFVEFPDQTPLANLQVTAAHEFFHAVQYGYDAYEDFWLLEGTATAIEDAVFNDINDNYQFLLSSQFTAPHKPVDLTSLDPSGPNFGHRYGSWIYFRYLSEAHGGNGGLPNAGVIKAIWDRADGSKHKQFGDKSSIKAIRSFVRGTKNFGKSFAMYGLQLFRPLFFSEGSEYLSFLQSRGANSAQLTKSFELGASVPTPGKLTKKIDHLSHRYYGYTRAADAPGDATLKFNLWLPKRKKGPVATVLADTSTGTHLWPVKLNKYGKGSVTVPFGSDVTSVVLILTNASTRFTKCEKRLYVYTTSCGKPKDDRQPFTFKAIVKQPVLP